ncbi:hypothetical protein BE21_13700 [Sorangium cellulosum]|uniref:Uncharacterized protein n=1 Tax=Sorangium cellulosum TaxID=56 RepID=A0A150TZP0_SORCE|nr:hypothetical protein BE21_13700 [Sorangium cellulosum]
MLPDDSLVLSGSYAEAIDFGSGVTLTAPTADEDGCFVVRFLSSSELIWSHNLFTGTGRLTVMDSSATHDGDVVLVGFFDGEVRLGSSTLTTASRDAFIVKLDGETGDVRWNLHLGGPEATMTTIEAMAVAVDRDGNIVVGGRFTGFTEVGFDESSASSPSGAGSFLLKLSPTGKRDWSVVIQGEGDAWLKDIDVDARGDVVAAAAFAGAIDVATHGVRGAQQTSGLADSDLLLVKLSSAGTHLWSLKFGDDLPQFHIDAGFRYMSPFGIHVAADAAGDVVLGAGIASAVDFGGGPLGGRQDRDWTIAKLSAGGEHLRSRRFGDAAAGQGIAGIDTDPATKALVVVGINDGVLDFGNEIKAAVAGGFSSVVAKVDLQRVGR